MALLQCKLSKSLNLNFQTFRDNVNSSNKQKSFKNGFFRNPRGSEINKTTTSKLSETKEITNITQIKIQPK